MLLREEGQRGGKNAIFIYWFVCPPVAGSPGAEQTRRSSRELGVQGGQLLCQQGKPRHAKGGDGLRLEEKVGWVPALRRVPEALGCSEETAAGHAMAGR